MLALVPSILMFSASCSLLFESDINNNGEAGSSASYTPSNLSDFSLASESIDCVVQSGETWLLDTNSATIYIDEAPLPDHRAPTLQTVNLNGGTSAVLLGCRSFELQSGATLRGEGQLALIVLARKDIILRGTVDVGARGPFSGPGVQTEGTPGSSNDSRFRVQGGSFGSHGGAGDSDLEDHLYGEPELVPLLGGSTGGDPKGAPEGGGGGGAIQFSAGLKLIVAGLINAGGGGGDGAGFSSYQSGAGGGSGGAVLLEAPLLLIEQTGYVGVNGGGGGGGGDPRNEEANGKPGQDGSRAPGLGGEANPAAHAGGDGAYASSPAYKSEGGGFIDSGGGGGGGAGRIRLNTRDKVEADYLQGLSPPMGAAFSTSLGSI